MLIVSILYCDAKICKINKDMHFKKNVKCKILATNKIMGNYTQNIEKARLKSDNYYYIERYDKAFPAIIVSASIVELLLSLEKGVHISDIYECYGSTKDKNMIREINKYLYLLISGGYVDVYHNEKILKNRELMSALYELMPIVISVIDTYNEIEYLSLCAIREVIKKKIFNYYDLFELLYKYNSGENTICKCSGIDEKNIYKSFLKLNKGHPLIKYGALLEFNEWREGWYTWKKIRVHKRQDIGYKVYVGVDISCVPEVFEIIATLFMESEATAIKISNGKSGLLRPDKLVVYFNEIEHAKKFCSYICRNYTISRYLSHAVPFTQQVIPNSSILSIGVDFRRMSLSWRQKVVSKLSCAIYFLKQQGVIEEEDYHKVIKVVLELNNIEYLRWAFIE